MSATTEKPKTQLREALRDGHNHAAHARAGIWVNSCSVCVAEMVLENEDFVCDHGSAFYDDSTCPCPCQAINVPDCPQCRLESEKRAP